MAESFESLTGEIEAVGSVALDEIEVATGAPALEELRVRFLGRKSALKKLMPRMKDVPPEKRADVGKTLNRVKNSIEQALAEAKKAGEARERTRRIEAEAIDITLPGRSPERGGLHPITRVMREMQDIFISMGFRVASGPEIEEEYYNFEALNIPADHPARDMQDTFYMNGGGVLRTHTSPVQIRTMRKHPPPIAIIAPGRVYRCDSDTTHSPMFHQIEGLLVDERVRFSDLKGVLGAFLRRMMGPDVKTRFRPSYFPFTEPSAEVDILWQVEGSRPKWLEVLGAGMVHPKVLEAGGYDPSRAAGFAFGMGVERFAMLKYGIPNIRMFFENDLRFLRQF